MALTAQQWGPGMSLFLFLLFLFLCWSRSRSRTADLFLILPYLFLFLSWHVHLFLRLCLWIIVNVSRYEIQVRESIWLRRLCSFTSFHLFLFCHGVKGGCDGGKKSATGSERGGERIWSFRSSWFSERICHSMESRTFHIHIRIQQKIRGKESIQPLCTAVTLCPWHPHDLPRTTYHFLFLLHNFFSFSGQVNIFQVMAMIPDPELHGFPFASRCSYQRCSCFCASRSTCPILLVRELVIAAGDCGFRACLFSGCHAVLIISWFSFLPLATGCIINALWLDFNFAKYCWEWCRFVLIRSIVAYSAYMAPEPSVKYRSA